MQTFNRRLVLFALLSLASASFLTSGFWAANTDSQNTSGNTLKGSVQKSVTPDYVSEVYGQFQHFKTLFTAHDAHIMNFYDPKAYVQIECQAPDGAQTVKLTHTQMRRYQEIYWKVFPDLDEIPMASFKPVQSVNPQKKHIPMIRVDYTLTSTLTAPSDFQAFTVVFERQTVSHAHKGKSKKKAKSLATASQYQWRIISQSARIVDPQGLNKKVLTALTDPAQQAQIDQLLQALASYKTPAAAETDSSDKPQAGPTASVGRKADQKPNSKRNGPDLARSDSKQMKDSMQAEAPQGVIETSTSTSSKTEAPQPEATTVNTSPKSEATSQLKP